MDEYSYKILNYWNDNGDVYVDYLVKNTKTNDKAHACALFNINDIDTSIETDKAEEYLINTIIKNKEKGYEFKLPKTSQINKITYDIFRELCNSENNMLYIENNDDFEQFNLNYETYKLLCNDIEKYNLQDYFMQTGEMLIVYGGLQCCFNDDRDERSGELER